MSKAAARCLIVNADDFGQSRAVNRGIARAHELGIVTSVSLMVRWPAACEAAEYAREHPELSVGLHLDLGEHTYRDGDWAPLYSVVAVQDAEEVAKEIARQFSAFESLLGKPPTHIDSHQHVHLDEPVRSLVTAKAYELDIPVRGSSPGVTYCGDFYGQTATGVPFPQGISVESLINTLSELLSGYTELGCHPGLEDDLQTMYCRERSEEVKTLCDPRVREALADLEIKLCSFHDVRF